MLMDSKHFPLRIKSFKDSYIYKEAKFGKFHANTLFSKNLYTSVPV